MVSLKLGVQSVSSGRRTAQSKAARADMLPMCNDWMAIPVTWLPRSAAPTV